MAGLLAERLMAIIFWNKHELVYTSIKYLEKSKVILEEFHVKLLDKL